MKRGRRAAPNLRARDYDTLERGAGLVLVVLLIVGLSSAEPSSFFTRGAVAVAILLLIFRQIARRMKGRAPRAAQPDPQSTLKLD